jgi:hypothetical protein
MKAITIKTKVILVLISSLALGAALQIWLVRDSYERNVVMVADSALSSAQCTFDSLKARQLGLVDDVSKQQAQDEMKST